ncbi:MAG: phosphoribosyltransferase [Bacteroidetes bacterium]|nr:MAG: phosphoribosyltransferase [Bacteroidota bacterium]
MIILENQILNSQQTLQKIRRMAYQIYERNFEENELILAGIHEKGIEIAKILAEELRKIAPISLRIVTVFLDKFAPLQSSIYLDTELELIENKTVILIDDVLNTGRTLAYSLKPFLNIPIKKLQTLLLVDRGYKSFPISADYVGYELSTTVKQHVEVVLDNPQTFGVYLY